MPSCRICEQRKPRRSCPSLQADICSLCCGASREETLDCPFDCRYLRDARQHEKPREIDPRQLPEPDLRITEDFLRQHEPLLAAAAEAVFKSAVNSRGVDSDVGEALAALVKTYRTLESGLIYETRPDNPYAARIQSDLQADLDAFRERVVRETGVTTIRDADVLKVLVFLARLQARQNNGRKRGRAFLHSLATHFESSPSNTPATP